MTEFGKALRNIRRERNLTLEELAAMLGTTKGVLSRYETTDRTPKISKVMEWAGILGVSLEELSGMSAFGTHKPTNVFVPDRHPVPILGEIACGSPIFAEENFNGTVKVSNVQCDFALWCKGDSMAPRLLDGDIVLIRKQSDVDDGAIAAVLIDDEATLKHVYHQSHGLMLTADNPAYPPMIFDSQNSTTLLILGLAVGFQRLI